MSTSSSEATRSCPQCDGTGQEEVRGIPIVCRKCAGAGGVAQMRRVASILCGGEALEKRAQEEFSGDEDYNPLGESFEDFAKSGDGLDPLAFVPKETSDHTLRIEIISMMRGLSSEAKMELFGKVLGITGTNAEEVARTVAGEDGKPLEAKVEMYLYTALDAMNRRQLASTHSALRQLV